MTSVCNHFIAVTARAGGGGGKGGGRGGGGEKGQRISQEHGRGCCLTNSGGEGVESAVEWEWREGLMSVFDIDWVKIESFPPGNFVTCPPPCPVVQFIFWSLKNAKINVFFLLKT